VALTGLLVSAAIGGFIWLAEESYNGLPFINYRTLYASLPNIGHLQTHDSVQIAGVKVGQVLRTSTANGRALVELQLTHVKPLPVDTQVRVRDNGLLGDRDVELVPGTSKKTLASGATIVGRASDYYPSLPDTLDLFNAKTRGALGQMLGGLGEGVLGRGLALNNAIHVGPPSGANFNTIAYSILSRPGAAARLLPATDAGIGALDAAREDLAGMLAPGATTLQAFTDERGPFDQAIAQAPGAERAAVAGLGPATGLKLLASLDTLAGAADRVLPYAPAALSSATRLLQSAPGPLERTKVVLAQVPSAVPAALGILGSLQPDLTPLTNAFTWLVGPVTDLGAHGCDIRDFTESWRSNLAHGSEPGGPFGPLGGFKAVLVEAGPQSLAGISPPSQLTSFPIHDAYKPACEFFPGPVYKADTLGTLLGLK
jgi:phospholipid/cholesterol/gamma-HCH transport system substrate-binding protein